MQKHRFRLLKAVFCVNETAHLNELLTHLYCLKFVT